uniref:Uncharacterized protein n=1 Tax=Aegilops tauschii subsp. strangulata TaxID=200361 RepID=A0A452Y9W6_AEGTS
YVNNHQFVKNTYNMLCCVGFGGVPSLAKNALIATFLCSVQVKEKKSVRESIWRRLGAKKPHNFSQFKDWKQKM